MRDLLSGAGGRPRLVRIVLAWSAVGVGALALSLGTNCFRPVTRGLQVSAEIVRQSREYQQQVRDNAALAAELAFLRSDEGARWAAWRYLGMVEPGWQVGRTVESSPAPVAPETRPRRVQEWIRREGEARARQVREAGETLAAYLGRRALDPAATTSNAGAGQVSKTGSDGLVAAPAGDG
jgi:hypothetical protein